MGSEKYKLKWSKYEANILSAFHGLLESESLSDVTLFCEGEENSILFAVVSFATSSQLKEVVTFTM
jgi:hypothetical protein